MDSRVVHKTKKIEKKKKKKTEILKINIAPKSIKEEAKGFTANGSHEHPDHIKMEVEKPQQPKRDSEQEDNWRDSDRKISHATPSVKNRNTP